MLLHCFLRNTANSNIFSTRSPVLHYARGPNECDVQTDKDFLLSLENKQVPPLRSTKIRVKKREQECNIGKSVAMGWVFLLLLLIFQPIKDILQYMQISCTEILSRDLGLNSESSISRSTTKFLSLY